mmetsp:Transcript_24028/g.51401  ORF Transcript_24028/g.51401 Transcript_24028/m.51401 type:complete len:256 (-) Transcript_24028:143-910(-)
MADLQAYASSHAQADAPPDATPHSLADQPAHAPSNAQAHPGPQGVLVPRHSRDRRHPVRLGHRLPRMDEGGRGAVQGLRGLLHGHRLLRGRRPPGEARRARRRRGHARRHELRRAQRRGHGAAPLDPRRHAHPRGPLAPHHAQEALRVAVHALRGPQRPAREELRHRAQGGLHHRRLPQVLLLGRRGRAVRLLRLPSGREHQAQGRRAHGRLEVVRDRDGSRPARAVVPRDEPEHHVEHPEEHRPGVRDGGGVHR